MGQPSPWLLVLVCFGRHHFHTLNIVKPPHFWQHNSAICHNSRTRKIYIWDDFHGMIPSINGITQPYVFFADWDDSLNPTDRFFFQWRHEVSPKIPLVPGPYPRSQTLISTKRQEPLVSFAPPADCRCGASQRPCSLVRKKVVRWKVERFVFSKPHCIVNSDPQKKMETSVITDINYINWFSSNM